MIFKIIVLIKMIFKLIVKIKFQKIVFTKMIQKINSNPTI